MPLPLIPIIISALGGAIVGGLARQPEINRLKKQVKLLQQEIGRLQRIVAEQNRQIQELTIRYKSLKAWQFSEKAQSKARTRGAVMHQYSFKEYVDLLCLQAKGSPISEAERRFFNAYENLLSGSDSSVDEKIVIRDYIVQKYSYEIRNLIPLDSERVTEVVEGTRIA